jgi:hypothetical protein
MEKEMCQTHITSKVSIKTTKKITRFHINFPKKVTTVEELAT